MSGARFFAPALARSWGLLLVVLGLFQACGGSGESIDPKSNASPTLEDAAQSGGPDAGIPSGLEPALGADSDASTDADGVSSSSVRDTANNEGTGIWDSTAEASQPIDSRDVVPLDMENDVSSVLPFCSTWDARDSGAAQQLCNDFTASTSSAEFTPEAGAWIVSQGSYNASGPSEQIICPGGEDGGSGMTASLLAGVSAQDVRIHAKLTSIVAPDKVLVLRSRPGGNRIELNFVANYTYEGEDRGGALHISELVNCVNTVYVDANVGSDRVWIPHAIGQAIVVDLQLVGTQLTVVVDGKQVFDNTLPVSNPSGSVGFAVFRDAETQFDDFLVEVLK